jgi:hypothetical protein
MKAQVVGNGTFAGTKVLDGETGEMIHRITKMTITAEAGKEDLVMELEMGPIMTDLEVEIKRVKIGNTWFVPEPRFSYYNSVICPC